MATARELAQELYQLRSQIEVFRRKANEVEERLAAKMEDKKLEIEGLAVFERRRRHDRKQWQHAELQSALIAKIRSGEARQIDGETGEIVVEDDIALTARVFTATANPTWRLTKLKELRIDPDEYATVVPGGYVIQIHGDLADGE